MDDSSFTSSNSQLYPFYTYKCNEHEHETNVTLFDFPTHEPIYDSYAEDDESNSLHFSFSYDNHNV